MPSSSSDNLTDYYADDLMSLAEPEIEFDRARPEYEMFVAFAHLTREKRQLNQRIKEIEGKLEVLQFQLRDLLGADGFQSVGVEGFTIFLRKQLFVRAREAWMAADVIAALKRNGMGHFVKEQYNSKTLSAHIRQLEVAHADELRSGELTTVGELLPPDLIAVLNIEPTYSVIALEKRKKE